MPVYNDAFSSSTGGSGGVAAGTVTAVDGNLPDGTGNAVSAGPKTAAATATLLANGSKADRAPLLTAFVGDGLLTGLLKDA